MSRRYEVTNAVIREMGDDSDVFQDMGYRCVNARITSASSPATSCTEDSSSDLTTITSRSLSEASLLSDNSEPINNSDKHCNYLFRELFSDLNLNEKQQRPGTNKDVKRANMSFTNEQSRQIKRENEILLKKIMSRSNSAPCRSSARPKPVKCSAEVNRKRRQEKINRENLILLRKIQDAKPCYRIKKTAKS